MKKILLLLSLMCFSLGFSQNAPITFEPGAFGNTWTWTQFENGSGVAPLVVANPSATGLNTTATVLKYTPVISGQPYAGFETSIGAGIGTFNLTAANCIVKILVYKSVISDVGIKFAANSASTGELKVANTLINQWEELTFDFSSKIGQASSTGINQIVFFMDFQARSTDNICYLDNIRFSAQTAPVAAVPAVAAATPTRPAANVLSLFSNAYTNIPMQTWKTDWSPGVVLTDLQIATNDTKKYTSLDFVGIEPSAPINATAMNFIHIDVWSPNMTTFKLKLVNQTAPQSEHEVSYTPIQNGWNSYDIPLANFTGLNSRAAIFQIILVGVPSAASTLYIDNVYFHNVAVVDPNTPQVAASTPTRLAANVISMFSNAYTNVPVTTWKTDWSPGVVLADIQIAGNDTKKYTGLDYVGIETVNPKINATPMSYFHFDLWTPNMTTVRAKLVDWGANGIYQSAAGTPSDDKEHELVFTPTLSGWNSYDILLSNFTGLTTKANIAQLIFSGISTGSTGGTLYIDNVYFAADAASNQSFVAQSIKMFPNPTTGIVEIESAKIIDNVSVYNVLGQEVLQSKTNSNRISVDISDFTAGIYIVKTTIDGQTSTSKISKK